LLPTRVENALKLGRPLATKVDATEPGSIAWVHVRPVILRELTWDALRESWTRSGEASPRFESPTAFVVRYTLLSHEHLKAEQRDDLDLAMRDDPPEDWAVIAPDLDSLEKVLGRFVHLSTFAFPRRLTTRSHPFSLPGGGCWTTCWVRSDPPLQYR
jgi:hypothetical protein